MQEHDYFMLLQCGVAAVPRGRAEPCAARSEPARKVSFFVRLRRGSVLLNGAQRIPRCFRLCSGASLPGRFISLPGLSGLVFSRLP